jgi:hypothetical protein
MEWTAERRSRRGGNAEPLSWPEFFGLLMRETGLPPREVAILDFDDVADLAASWKRDPPIGAKLDRIAQALMVGLGLKEQRGPMRGLSTEDMRIATEALLGKVSA